MAGHGTLVALRVGCGLARLFPFHTCAAVGAATGWLASWVSPRRSVVRANLACIQAAREAEFERAGSGAIAEPPSTAPPSTVPPATVPPRRGLTRRGPARLSVASVFAAYGRYWGEFLAMAARPERLRRLRVTVEGEEHLHAAAASGPVCVLTGHLGNWDLGSRVLVQILPHFAVVAEELEPRALFSFFARTRRQAGLVVIPASGGGLRLFRHLRRGGHAGFVADRVFGAGSRAVPFLGGIREFPAAGMDLARRAGAALVPMFFVREGPSYRLRIHPPLGPNEDPVAAFARVLAAEALSFAEQWCLLYPLHASEAGTRPARVLPEPQRATLA